MATRSTKRLPARQRLLDAASLIFARDGLTGATTREIARNAGVNEVTLFRVFGSKDRLLAEVVSKAFPESAQAKPELGTGNLRQDLLSYAQLYERKLTENLPLVRTLIGEIQHFDKSQERQVFHGIFGPIRAALVTLLKKARDDKRIRRNVSPVILADLFNGMIFSQVLRRSSPHSCPVYSLKDFHRYAVETLLRGAEATGAT
jgi:AcrR family transcriptional regulator